jgi:hypothetical protein
MKIFSGMLCTSLGTFTDYRRWMTDSGFAEIRAHDVTRQVEKSVGLCSANSVSPSGARIFCRSWDRKRGSLRPLSAECAAPTERERCFTGCLAHENHDIAEAPSTRTAAAAS